jgi:hypothetical protein
MTFHQGNQTTFSPENSRGNAMNGLKRRYPGHHNGMTTLDPAKETEKPNQNMAVKVHEIFQREKQPILVPESTRGNPMNGIKNRTTLDLENP